MKYSGKILLLRIVFLIIAIACVILIIYKVYDYFFFILSITLFIGLFPVTIAEVKNTSVFIRKHYFWGIFGSIKEIPFQHIHDIYSTTYEWDMTDVISDDNVTEWAVLLSPKDVKWINVKLIYMENGREKKTETKINLTGFQFIIKFIKESKIPA